MKKPTIKIQKEKLIGFANDIGKATKDAMTVVSENVKDGSEQISQQIDKAIFDKDKKKLCPFFKENLLADGFVIPPMIRLVNYDKRKENRACEGSIGFIVNTKDLKVLNIYTEYSDLLGLIFYPHTQESVYYVDPCHPKLYINLDEYFSYLKKVRVDELKQIAQSLGAKHVKISLKEQKKDISSQNKNGKVHLFNKIGGNASCDKTNEVYNNINVEAEVNFSGNDNPVRPDIVYFKNESDIQALIEMRVNPTNQNKINSMTYVFNYINSSEIQVREAAKIDAALSSIKANGSSSVSSKALTESRTILEYSIEF